MSPLHYAFYGVKNRYQVFFHSEGLDTSAAEVKRALGDVRSLVRYQSVDLRYYAVEWIGDKVVYTAYMATYDWGGRENAFVAVSLLVPAGKAIVGGPAVWLDRMLAEYSRQYVGADFKIRPQKEEPAPFDSILNNMSLVGNTAPGTPTKQKGYGEVRFAQGEIDGYLSNPDQSSFAGYTKIFFLPAGQARIACAPQVCLISPREEMESSFSTLQPDIELEVTANEVAVPEVPESHPSPELQEEISLALPQAVSSTDEPGSDQPKPKTGLYLFGGAVLVILLLIALMNGGGYDQGQEKSTNNQTLIEDKDSNVAKANAVLEEKQRKARELMAVADAGKLKATKTYKRYLDWANSTATTDFSTTQLRKKYQAKLALMVEISNLEFSARTKTGQAQKDALDKLRSKVQDPKLTPAQKATIREKIERILLK